MKDLCPLDKKEKKWEECSVCDNYLSCLSSKNIMYKKHQEENVNLLTNLQTSLFLLKSKKH